MANVNEELQLTHILLGDDDFSTDLSMFSKSQLLKIQAQLSLFSEKITNCQSAIQATLENMQNPTNIPELIQAVSNDFQKEVLRRLIVNTDDFSQMYLSKYETNTSQDKRRKDIQGTFTVLGTVRKGKREEYTVKFYKKHTPNSPSFWCSCPDHKFNSTKKNICCKHICFLLCKVAKLFQPDFYENKVLDDETYDKFKQIAENLHHVMSDDLVVSPEPVTAVNDKFPEMFKVKRKEVCSDDLCPICYDDMPVQTSLLSCPDCSNNVHAECMKVWLESRKTCVYCRSNVWYNCRV